MSKLYPIKFENMYYERIWGGNDFNKFRDNAPQDKKIGESWDIACHKEDIGTVSNGFLKGKKFNEIIDLYGEKLLGKEVNNEHFPLLVKLISADENLSIQVHPDDEYANKVENDSGKTEAWYIIDVKEDSYIICGLKNCDKDTFLKAVENNTFEPYLNKIKVKSGDFFYIKSGLVHAIGKGILLAEIQQNSDTTYRVYDYNRGRELHIQKAADVIDFSLESPKVANSAEDICDNKKICLCNTGFFCIEKYIINSSISEESNPNKFYLFTCVKGDGIIKYNTDQTVTISMGESIMIPAALGKYELIGNITLLKSYI